MWLTLCYGPTKAQIPKGKPTRTGPRKLTEDCKQSILNFYHNDEISRQAPVKADVKSLKDPNTGKRSLKQIRHMVMGIKEAYKESKTSHPEMTISRSKFFSLRPQHILPVGNMPNNVCVCRCHANATYLVEAISKCDTSFPKTHEELLKAVCCDTSSEKCMVNDCKKCVDEVRTLLSKNCALKKNLQMEAASRHRKCHSQVSIFTCYLWHEKEVESYIVVSNDLKHSKYSVWICRKSIFNTIREAMPEINHIYLFSDICAAQFKSIFSVTNVCFSKADFGVTIEWDFFPSGHGIGAVDGLGGTIKRLVWRAAQGRLAVINSALDFYNFCADKCKGIMVL
ncbi:hypothetical protein PR048_029124 [Dryococelus australis]|uniref:Uncharacterized protein n=1 Tax=Dryococelus australis TaxID=614101 RepID=A0ABQ9GCH0_9NEOP|nr:hypothetical protein PR048_029124 [Dryococelus australis]